MATHGKPPDRIGPNPVAEALRRHAEEEALQKAAEKRHEYEERAAIMEHDGKLPRAEAERLAREIVYP